MIRQLLVAFASALFGCHANLAVTVVDSPFGLDKFVPSTTCVAPDPSSLPPRLSETGCVDHLHPAVVAEELLPFELNVPSWNGGAQKSGWFTLPEGRQISVNGGQLQFPPGTVLMMNLLVDGKSLETQFYSASNTGEWFGYTYAWRADGSDADLVPADGGLFTIGAISWPILSRDTCIQCHNDANGNAPGMEFGQLNRAVIFASERRSNQLATLDHLGLLAPALTASPDTLPVYVADDGNAAIDIRARDYLHANCANCHRPNSSSEFLDLRASTPLGSTQLCGIAATRSFAQFPGALRLSPGFPLESLTTLRMRSSDQNVHMPLPNVGALTIDTDGVAVVEQWIGSISSCN